MNIYSVLILIGFVAFAVVAVGNLLTWLVSGAPISAPERPRRVSESQRQNDAMVKRSQEANAARRALDAEATERSNSGANCYPIPDLDALRAAAEYKSLPSAKSAPRLSAPRVRRAGYLPDPDVVDAEWVRDL